MKTKTKINTSPAYRLYILMRDDLPSMNPGKGMAQAAHAANLFIDMCGHKRSAKEWQREGGGFGTTITLAVDRETLMRIVDEADELKIPAGLVNDTTYPMLTNREIAALISPDLQTDSPIFKDNGQVVVFRDEVTCGFVFLQAGSREAETLVGGLPLHP